MYWKNKWKLSYFHKVNKYLTWKHHSTCCFWTRTRFTELFLLPFWGAYCFLVLASGGPDDVCYFTGRHIASSHRSRDSHYGRRDLWGMLRWRLFSQGPRVWPLGPLWPQLPRTSRQVCSLPNSNQGGERGPATLNFSITKNLKESVFFFKCLLKKVAFYVTLKFASVFLDGVLISLCPAWQCPCIPVVQEAT